MIESCCSAPAINVRRATCITLILDAVFLAKYAFATLPPGIHAEATHSEATENRVSAWSVPCRTASSGEPIAAIFHLSDCAALVMEDWSPDVPAYALAWTCGTTRNHKALWQEFLAHEALTDQTLQEQFLILHKIGPPPAYLRTLLGTCVDNLLSLWENFVLFQHEKTGSGTVLQAQAQLFNSTDCNLEAWQSECTLQLKMLPTCPADLSVLQVGLHERRAELVLQADSAACDERSHLALAKSSQQLDVRLRVCGWATKPKRGRQLHALDGPVCGCRVGPVVENTTQHTSAADGYG